MDAAALTITIIKTTWTLAGEVKKLIQSTKQHDETVRGLEEQIDTFTSILLEALGLYGHDESSQHSASEQRTRDALRAVVVRCKKDLTNFEAKLKQMKGDGPWAMKAWKQVIVAPELAKVKKSLSDSQSHLKMLVHLLQGLQLNRIEEMQVEIRRMLEALANGSNANDPSSTINEEILSVATTLIEGEGSQIQDAKRNESNRNSENEPKTPEDPEGDPNGLALLKAIEEDDTDTFESLVRDDETSLRETDSKGRDPLLLAAHLDKPGKVQELLAEHASSESKKESSPKSPNRSMDEVSPPSLNIGDPESPLTSSRHTIDLTATDALGRNPLHYEAEFDMCDAANFSLNRGVDVNARDNADLPPAYYAVKSRKYDAAKLLLEKGASADFERPTTSREVKELLEKTPSNE
ncbi:MAG: hypothetical protein Q9222_003289 [Ikaeria aurantiellina]